MIETMQPVAGTEKDLEKSGFIYEPKLDGFRAVAHRGKLLSRKGIRLDYGIEVPANVTLDGELIAYYNGKIDLNALQEKKGTFMYFAFDILECEGKDVRHLPLAERKGLLEKVEQTPLIRHVAFGKDGNVIWKFVLERNLEGVVAKRADSRYIAGKSNKWIKIKPRPTEDYAVVGYVGLNDVVALALATYDGKQFNYAGLVGYRRPLNGELAQLVGSIPGTPLPNAPDHISWIKPLLTCEIESYAGRRTFKCFRIDKSPTECTDSQSF